MERAQSTQFTSRGMGARAWANFMVSSERATSTGLSSEQDPSLTLTCMQRSFRSKKTTH